MKYIIPCHICVQILFFSCLQIFVLTNNNRVEWEYLYAIMRSLGFSENWMLLIMKCVSSVSFSVRVNGVFSDTFKPMRGIR
jgi:hypothetical protein